METERLQGDGVDRQRDGGDRSRGETDRHVNRETVIGTEQNVSVTGQAVGEVRETKK